MKNTRHSNKQPMQHSMGLTCARGIFRTGALTALIAAMSLSFSAPALAQGKSAAPAAKQAQPARPALAAASSDKTARPAPSAPQQRASQQRATRNSAPSARQAARPAATNNRPAATNRTPAPARQPAARPSQPAPSKTAPVPTRNQPAAAPSRSRSQPSVAPTRPSPQQVQRPATTQRNSNARPPLAKPTTDAGAPSRPSLQPNTTTGPQRPVVQNRPQIRTSSPARPSLDDRRSQSRPMLMPRDPKAQAGVDRARQMPDRTRRIGPALRDRSDESRAIHRPQRNARPPLATFDRDHRQLRHNRSSGAHHWSNERHRHSVATHRLRSHHHFGFHRHHHRSYVPVSRRPSFWFNLHLSTRPYCYTYVRPRYVSYWHSPWHWTTCPTWWSPIPTVYYFRPMARPVYLSTYYHTTYVTSPSVHTVQTVQTIPADPCTFDPQQAWLFLADENVHYALEAFACLAREYPYDGLMHVGYAMANAMLGADESAVAVMRHAVQVDPESLLYVPDDTRIDQLVGSLVRLYGNQVSDPARQRDAMFMIAALHTTVHDYAGAYFAATEAINHGANDDETQRLRTMVADLLADQMLNRG